MEYWIGNKDKTEMFQAECSSDLTIDISYNLVYFLSYVDGDLSLLGRWNLRTSLGQHKHSIRCDRLGGNLHFSSQDELPRLEY